MSISLIIVLALTLVAEFANGLTDAPNAIATVVATRVLSPYKAVIMAAVLNIAGALLTGTAVASTIGKDIIQPEAVGLHTVAAALLTIVIWTGLAWRLGLPTSKTHEMVAGLAGAGIATAGTSDMGRLAKSAYRTRSFHHLGFRIRPYHHVLYLLDIPPHPAQHCEIYIRQTADSILGFHGLQPWQQ
jgi:phosphate/sulfate permease